MAKIKNKPEKRKNLLSMYELDSMWMSYRYCIGRHTIASHYRASDIAVHCYGRLTPEKSIFTAYDMNRSIEEAMRFNKVRWIFPLGVQNRIYTTAIDILCEFIEDYSIKSKEEFLEYKTINVILTDNSRGYKIEAEKWDKDDPNKPSPEYFYMYDYEDLFIWNDLCHLFDLEHHYKVELTDGTIEEVFDTWTSKSEKREDGHYYKTFGYTKITVPVKSWTGHSTVYIPKENIKRIVE